MAELIQNTYANALFEVSDISKVTNAKNINEELVELKVIFSKNKDYIRLLSSPACSKLEKHKLLDQAFGECLSGYTLNFLKLLVDNGRFASINSIIDEYCHIYDSHNGIMQVTAITATKLDSDLEEKLVHKLNKVTGKKVTLNNVLDKSVLGGIKLRYDNTEIDGTVKTKLDELKQMIKQSTI